MLLCSVLPCLLEQNRVLGSGEVGCCAWPDHKYKLRHNLDTKQTVKSGRQRGASASASNTKNNKNGVSWPLAQARAPRPETDQSNNCDGNSRGCGTLSASGSCSPSPSLPLSLPLTPLCIPPAYSASVRFLLLPLPLSLPSFCCLCRLLFFSGRFAWCLLFITHTRSINGKCSRSRRSRHCWTNPSKAVPASPHLTWAPPIRSHPNQTGLH